MEIRKISGGEETREVLTGMIVDDYCLATIAAQWQDDGLFSDGWSNLIGSWCVGYHEKYNKAPKQDIASLHRKWRKRNKDEATAKSIKKFLHSISDDYDPDAFNSQYVVDLAHEYFNGVKLEGMLEKAADLKDRGKVGKALELVSSFGTIEIAGTKGIDVLRDTANLQHAFDAKQDALIQYPGALGEFLGDELCRDGFIALMGPEKRGKSFWLLDLSIMGVKQGRKVAIFEVGDMSQSQVTRRLASRVSSRPIKNEPYSVPTDIFLDPDEDFPVVAFKEVEEPKVLTPKIAAKAMKKLAGEDAEPKLKLHVSPNSTMSVLGIKSILQSWARAGWVPDIVVIDYADILAPPAGYMDSRDAINTNWKQLRALSQAMHCLVLTATQADAASYSEATLGRQNFTDDKRKYGHVTGMIGLNATESEMELQQMRLNWLVLRDGAFLTSRCVHVSNCLAIAKPHMQSCWPRKN